MEKIQEILASRGDLYRAADGGGLDRFGILPRKPSIWSLHIVALRKRESPLPERRRDQARRMRVVAYG
jgi:hypothetical protein